MTEAIEVRPLATDALTDPWVLRELAGKYLVWDAFVGGNARVQINPLWLPAAVHADAVTVAEQVVRTVSSEVASRALEDPAECARYGLHPDVVTLAHASYAAHDDARLARVDLLLGEDGQWHACEINADCPGGHNEAFGLPRLARAKGFLLGDNPTVMLDRLADRLADMASQGLRRGAVALLYATAYAEDLQVCALLQRALERRGTPTVRCAPTALRPSPTGGLRAGGRDVSVLYRFVPAEYMEGLANLAAIATAVREGHVRCLSSFAEVFAQSKLALARAWEVRASLSPDARDTVDAHVPYTLDLARMPRELLVAERARWVVKKALGRVGDEVFVGALWPDDAWGPLLDDVYLSHAGGEAWVAQAFVPQREIETPWGPRLVTLGAYVLDGHFVGYYARVTPQSHVSHDALCVPVFTGEPS